MVRKPQSIDGLDPAIIALGIRQPWAELILRGIKTLEIRSQNTRLRGTIYIYASKKVSALAAARDAARAHSLDLVVLPRGLLVGSVELHGSRQATSADAVRAVVPEALVKGQFAWELQNARRFPEPAQVKYLPFGVWFYPYQRGRRAPARRVTR